MAASIFACCGSSKFNQCVIHQLLLAGETVDYPGRLGETGSGEVSRSEDDRFVDYIGPTQSIVTSGGSNDGGMFETNLRDERFLPFEGAGAESTWKLELPRDYPAFDYATISDVILDIRYTARWRQIPC